MIKLFSMKNQKKEGTESQSNPGTKRASAAQLRITKGTVFYYLLIYIYLEVLNSCKIFKQKFYFNIFKYLL